MSRSRTEAATLADTLIGGPERTLLSGFTNRSGRGGKLVGGAASEVAPSSRLIFSHPLSFSAPTEPGKWVSRDPELAATRPVNYATLA